MTHLGLRFQIACRLAGQGSLEFFASVHDVDPSNLSAGTMGRRALPERLRKAVEEFIREEFERHAEVLDLRGNP